MLLFNTHIIINMLLFNMLVIKKSFSVRIFKDSTPRESKILAIVQYFSFYIISYQFVRNKKKLGAKIAYSLNLLICNLDS